MFLNHLLNFVYVIFIFSTNIDFTRKDEITLLTLKQCGEYIDYEEKSNLERIFVSKLIKITCNSFFKNNRFVIKNEILNLLHQIKFEEIIIKDTKHFEIICLVYFVSEISNIEYFVDTHESKYNFITDNFTEKINLNDLNIAQNICSTVFRVCDNFNQFFRSNEVDKSYYTINDIDINILDELTINNDEHFFNTLERVKNSLTNNFTNRILFCPYKSSKSKLYDTLDIIPIEDFGKILNTRRLLFMNIESKSYVLEYFNDDILMYVYSYIFKILGELNLKWFDCRLENTFNEYFIVFDMKDQRECMNHYSYLEIDAWKEEERLLLKMTHYITSVDLLISYRKLHISKNKLQSINLARYYLMETKYLYEKYKNPNYDLIYHDFESIPYYPKDIQYDRLDKSIQAPCDLDKIYKKSDEDIYFEDSINELDNFIINTRSIINKNFDIKWSKLKILDNLKEIYRAETSYEKNENIHDLKYYEKNKIEKDKNVMILSKIDKNISVVVLVLYNMFADIENEINNTNLVEKIYNKTFKKLIKLRNKNEIDIRKIAAENFESILKIIEKYNKLSFMDIKNDDKIILWTFSKLYELHKISDEDVYNEIFLDSLGRINIKDLKDWNDVKIFMSYVDRIAKCRILQKKYSQEICKRLSILSYMEKINLKTPYENIRIEIDN